MDEFITFVLAFGKRWTTVMSGAAGLVLTGLGSSGSVPAGWAFVVAGMLCFFWACFLVWRDEYRKTAEDPRILEERRKTFDRHIADLQSGQIWLLRRVVIDGLMPENSGLTFLQGKTNLVIKDSGAIFRPNPAYLRLLQDWAKRTPDPMDKDPGRGGSLSSW
jgi:hypothetical protein